MKKRIVKSICSFLIVTHLFSVCYQCGAFAQSQSSSSSTRPATSSSAKPASTQTTKSSAAQAPAGDTLKKTLPKNMSAMSVGGSASAPASINQAALKSFQNDPFTGRATFSVPIQVAPGRKGVQPSIALAYASGQGNGLLGIGWGFEFGHFERSTKRGVPQYDDTLDTFVFVSPGSSQELVKIPGTSEYRSKIESGYSKIIYNGTTWTVIDKTGTKYCFGQTDDSMQKNGTKVYSWYLTRAEDIHGYYMTLAYSQDSNQVYPQKISYTGFAPKNEQPLSAVEFTLEDREDKIINYRSGMKIETKKRIKQIEAKFNNKLQNKYLISYEYSDNRNSLLKSVTQYGMDGLTSLSPITFNYQVKKSSFEPIGAWNGVWSNGNDYTWGSPRAMSGADGHTYVDILDINGDGLPDRVLRASNSTYDHFGVQLNNKNGFDQSINWNGVWSNGNDHTWGSPRAISGADGYTYVDIFDINGDGLPDRVLRATNSSYDHFDVQLNNGSIFNAITRWGGVWSNNNSYSWGSPRSSAQDHTYVDIVDINGDGLPDRVLRATNSTYDHFDVQLNDGNGFDAITRWPGVWSNNNSYSWGNPRASSSGYVSVDLFDINGDGLPDRVLRASNSVYDHFDVQLNNGNGFDAIARWEGVYSNGNDYTWGSPRSTAYNHTYVDIFDINGDGLPDRVLRASNSAYDHFDVQLNNGHGFEPLIRWESVFSNGNDYTWGSPRATDSNHSYVDLFDITGDGLPDRVLRANNGAYDHFDVQAGSNTTPNLLSSVDNGIGGTIQVEYTPSTQFDNKDASGRARLPFPMYAVTKVTSDDGRGHSYSSTYQYKGGYFDTTDREFRGFNEVRSFDADGNFTVATFKQDPVFKGRPDSQETRDKYGLLYSRSENTWKSKALNPGDFVYLEKAKNYLYDGDTQTAPLQTQVTYEYDAYGNPTKVVSSGDLAITGDERTQVIEYVYNTTSYALALPKHTSSSDSANNKLSEKWFYYDNAASIDTAPVKGFLTKEEIKITNPLTSTSTLAAATYAYDEYTLLSSVTDALGRTSSTRYDSLTHSFPAQVTNALGQSVKTVYYGINESSGDGLAGSGLIGQVKFSQDLNEQKTYQVYDALGRLVKVIGPLETAQSAAVLFSYDLTSRPIKITKQVKTNYEVPATYYTSFSFYDGLGRVIETKSPAQTDLRTGQARQIVSGLTIFDQRGLVKEKYLNYYVNESADFIAPSFTTPHATFDYDAMGRLIKTTNPDATFSNVTYNRLKVTATDEKNVSKSSYKDIYGRVIKIEERNGSQVYTTIYDYDALGNLIKLTDNQGNITQIVYDSLGKKIKMTDPDMGTWFYEYDALGNLTKQTDAKGQILSFDYDSLNRLAKKSAVNGQQSTALATYLYDDTSKSNCIGRLSKVTYPSGSTEFFYDVWGREIKSIKSVSGSAYQVSRTYDATDRLLTLTYPDNSTVKYEHNPQGISRVFTVDSGLSTVDYVKSIAYSPTGQFTSITYGNGATTTYEYNPLTLRLSHLVTQSSQGKLQDLSYQFDKAGNVSQITDTVNSANQSFVYDDINRLTQATGAYGVFSYSYDSIGNMLSKEGNTLRYGKNGLLPHAVTSMTGSLGTFSFDYDANGNMIKKNATALTYDTENRLSKVEDTNTQKTISVQFSPGWNFFSLPIIPASSSIASVLSPIAGKYNQVSRYNAATKTFEHYVANSKYDQFSSFEPLRGYQIYITSSTPITLSIAGNIPTTAQTLQIKTGNNLIGCPKTLETPVEQALSALKIGADYSKVLSYDTQAKKFIEYSGSKKEFSTLKPGQAYYISATKDTLWTLNSGLSTTTFIYDGDGGRVKKAISSQSSTVSETTYVGSLYELIAESGQQKTTKYIYAGGNRICSIESTSQQPSTQNAYYYHSDHLGSSNVVSDSTGKQAGFTEFTPYGSTFRQTGPYDPKRKFTGKELDVSTGLYYYGARYYDPQTGRFISADTIVPELFDSQTLNRYSYCYNNPINYVDPSGHIAFLALIGIIAKVAAAISITTAVASGINHLAGNASLAQTFSQISQYSGYLAAAAGIGSLIGNALNPANAAAASHETAYWKALEPYFGGGEIPGNIELPKIVITPLTLGEKIAMGWENASSAVKSGISAFASSQIVSNTINGYYFGTQFGESSARWYATQALNASGFERFAYNAGCFGSSLWTPQTWFATTNTLLLGGQLNSIMKATYWQYYPAENPGYTSPWMVRGEKPPYPLGDAAKKALNLPDHNPATGVRRVNVNPWEPVRGPRPVKGGTGEEYYRSSKWPN